MRVLSYNIQEGGGDRLPRVASIIREQHPDAVAVLEASSRPKAEALARDLSMDLIYGEANGEYAIAWLSHLPVVRAQNHRLAILAKTLLEIEVIYEGESLSLFAAHLVHGRTEGDARRRAEEVRAILDVLSLRGDRRHLLVGDFNAVHPDDSVGNPPPNAKLGHVARLPIQQILEAGYVDCYRALTADEPGYTYPSVYPWLRLDYIFASPAMAADLRACRVVDGQAARLASDHLPVWAEFRRQVESA